MVRVDRPSLSVINIWLSASGTNLGGGQRAAGGHRQAQVFARLAERLRTRLEVGTDEQRRLPRLG